MIPYGRQDIQQEDIDAVRSVLVSDFLTQGPVVPQFEASLAKKVGAEFAVAMNSATSALHVACLALDIGPGDLVWTSPITFVASANCAVLAGADVDFVDIDPETFNMSPEALEVKLEQASRAARLPKAIIPVHMCGQSPKMREIHGLAQKYGVRLIEDASHSVGGSYLGEAVGGCRYSDITVFSFHPVKIITSAEGGMATTQQSELAERMSELRSHGVTRDPSRMTQPDEGPWYYEQIDLGPNYRMTDLHAALGLSQLSRLDQYVSLRNTLADRYDRLLADAPVFCPGRDPGCYSAFHLYVVRLKEAAKRRAVFETMRSKGIGVNVHYIPVHLQPFYRNRGFAEGDFPAAEDYYRRAISIPLFPTLSESDQDTVVKCLLDAIDQVEVAS